jgi:hypothetical protein
MIISRPNKYKLQKLILQWGNHEVVASADCDWNRSRLWLHPATCPRCFRAGNREMRRSLQGHEF